jgi:hypothetical protein
MFKLVFSLFFKLKGRYSGFIACAATDLIAFTAPHDGARFSRRFAIGARYAGVSDAVARHVQVLRLQPAGTSRCSMASRRGSR